LFSLFPPLRGSSPGLRFFPISCRLDLLQPFLTSSLSYGHLVIIFSWFAGKRLRVSFGPRRVCLLFVFVLPTRNALRGHLFFFSGQVAFSSPYCFSRLPHPLCLLRFLLFNPVPAFPLFVRIFSSSAYGVFFSVFEPLTTHTLVNVVLPHDSWELQDFVHVLCRDGKGGRYVCLVAALCGG